MNTVAQEQLATHIGLTKTLFIATLCLTLRIKEILMHTIDELAIYPVKEGLYWSSPIAR